MGKLFQQRDTNQAGAERDERIFRLIIFVIMLLTPTWDSDKSTLREDAFINYESARAVVHRWDLRSQRKKIDIQHRVQYIQLLVFFSCNEEYFW